MITDIERRDNFFYLKPNYERNLKQAEKVHLDRPMRKKSHTLILIPFKGPPTSKSRIRKHLSVDSRKLFDSLILEIFRETLSKARNVSETIGVVSPSNKILDTAKEFGAKFLFKDQGISLNQALEGFLSHDTPEWNSVLILMGDLPLLTEEDILYILKESQGSDCVIVPSKREKKRPQGTAMLFQKPPLNFPLQFGENSSSRHIKEAKLAHLRYKAIENERISFDLDTLDDLQVLERLDLHGKLSVMTRALVQPDTHVSESAE